MPCGSGGLGYRWWNRQAALYVGLDGVHLMASGDWDGVHLMARDACAQLTISQLASCTIDHLTTLATTVVRSAYFIQPTNDITFNPLGSPSTSHDRH